MKNAKTPACADLQEKCVRAQIYRRFFILGLNFVRAHSQWALVSANAVISARRNADRENELPRRKQRGINSLNLNSFSGKPRGIEPKEIEILIRTI